MASFWIDVRGQEVKATEYFRDAASDRLAVVASMAKGVE